MIYLASPYTHPDAEVRLRRYESARDHAFHYMQTGQIIFSPIAYGHEFVRYGESVINFAYWQQFNEHMLLTSKHLYVLMLPEWEKSTGVVAEIEMAERHGISTYYVKPFKGVSHESI